MKGTGCHLSDGRYAITYNLCRNTKKLNFQRHLYNKVSGVRYSGIQSACAHKTSQKLLMKKLFSPPIVLLIIVFVLLIYNKAEAQSDTTMRKQKAARWFESYKQANELHLNPHKSTNKKEFAKQYHNDKERWDKAFLFLKENKLDTLTPGKYQIEGEDVYATVTEGPAKDFEKTAWESHRNYHDIHYVIKGKEKIGIAPVSSATVTKDYDSEKDILFYTAKGKYYITDPDTFFIIFPQDAHRPGIKVEGFDEVKKIVIKIRKGI